MTPLTNRPAWSLRLLALAGCLALIAAGYVFVARPAYLRWGATDAEIGRALPGDELVPQARAQVTRAITIDAPIDRVWPWLAQLGQDRGGFYSYDALENLVGCEMPTTDVLLPGKQAWQVGDRLWMYPPDKAGGAGFATLRRFEPGRVLAFGTRVVGTPLSEPENGSWTFVLEPIAASTTRLIVRGRGAAGRSLGGRVFDAGFFDPAHFAMERRMLIGIKQLAEGAGRGRALNHVQVALWTITFALFVAGIVILVRGTRGVQAIAGVLASAAVFQVLTFVQPPIAVAAALTILTAFVVRWPAPRAARGNVA